MQKYINTIVKNALDEDLKPHGDITTNLISFKDKKAKAHLDVIIPLLESFSLQDQDSIRRDVLSILQESCSIQTKGML